MAVARGGQTGSGARAGTGVLINPGTGAFGTVGDAMMQSKEGGGGETRDYGAGAPDPARELEEIKRKLASDELSGEQKQALRARKKELQEQLGMYFSTL